MGMIQHSNLMSGSDLRNQFSSASKDFFLNLGDKLSTWKMKIFIQNHSGFPDASTVVCNICKDGSEAVSNE